MSFEYSDLELHLLPLFPRDIIRYTLSPFLFCPHDKPIDNIYNNRCYPSCIMEYILPDPLENAFVGCCIGRKGVGKQD